jgi:hypothetical protein
VYINSNLVIDDRSGRSDEPARLADVTRYLKSGTNLIAVKAHDSFGIFEALHLTLRAGAQDLVNSVVSFVVEQSSQRTTTNTVGCPANYIGRFSFNAKLTNNTSQIDLSEVIIEIQNIGNENLVFCQSSFDRLLYSEVPIKA